MFGSTALIFRQGSSKKQIIGFVLKLPKGILGLLLIACAPDAVELMMQDASSRPTCILRVAAPKPVICRPREGARAAYR
jgi:hypothetical protein